MVGKLNTVGSSTYHRLKNDIIFGVLEPGKKLKLNALRDGYEASLSTLRETLNRLSSEGFVAAEEQRGFFVTPSDSLAVIAALDPSAKALVKAELRAFCAASITLVIYHTDQDASAAAATGRRRGVVAARGARGCQPRRRAPRA